jgi:DNA replication and repair protein RecF
MYLRSLELNNFRSFPTGRFEFSPGINIIYGPNTSGKTNLLEAIYVLSNLRSFRTHIFRDLIYWGETQAHVRGTVQSGRLSNLSRGEDGANAQLEETESSTSVRTLAIGIEPTERVLLVNSKQCKSSKEYLQILPSTAFIPDDLSLVKGEPASRRYFLNRGTFQSYPPYWSLLEDYKRILHQKNALLRELKSGGQERGKGTGRSSSGYSKGDSCAVWDEQLQSVGSKIILQRIRFIHNLQRLLDRIYDNWLVGKETITLGYKSSIRLSREEFLNLPNSEEIDSDTMYNYIFETYGQAIQNNIDRERQLGMTVVGPHRDDLEIELSGKSLRAFGSQGQQRTAVLALKFAEVYLYFERYAEYSLLLLDDVTSELDVNRTGRLFEYLQRGMQVFISATSKPEFFRDTSLSCAYFDLSKSNPA